jgi:hypothetical protein
VIPNDVSPFTGGLVRHILKGAGASGDAQRKLALASIVVLPLVAWLPLFFLSAADRELLPGSVRSPFLLDLSAHIRLLAALPLFLLAGRIAAARLQATLAQFLARSLVPDTSLERFHAAVASALRLGDSIVADVAIIALVYGLDFVFLWRTGDAVNPGSWRALGGANGAGISPAGAYYAYVSVPIFEFVLFRWYYRLIVWARFLTQVSKLKLRLIPANPDRVGGLGFLLLGTQAFTAFAIAHGTLLTAWLSNRVLIRGIHLFDYKMEIAAVVVFVLCITLAPLLTFTLPLMRAKRHGIEDYGALAARYAREFDDKWIAATSPCNEPLVGSSDVQSLADMGGSYDIVASMRNVPITGQMLLGFAVATLLPVAPLLLAVMPLSEILSKLVNILF